MKRMYKRKKTDSDLEKEEHLKTFLKIVPNEEGIVDYEVLEKIFPIISWESKFYHYDRHGAEGIYYRIFRSDGSPRWIKTFSEMLTRFDRLDLVELYNLVMQRFETTTPEEEVSTHKETLEKMMSLKLVAESTSDGAYNLLRSIQKQIDESRSFDGKLASPKQMALGKDFSNPLMVDSLPKTIWLSMHHVIAMKHWLFQSKRLLSQKSSSSSKSRLKNSYVFGYILQVIKKLKLKKHEVSTASTSVSTGSRVSTVSSKKYDNTLPLTKRRLVKYLRKMSNTLFTRISEDNWENHKEAVVNYADLKASINDYYDENIAHQD
ncbi:hypothetical protein Tco_0215764 [Tanacetum coccineum]